jgi:hypothetical protein
VRHAIFGTDTWRSGAMLGKARSLHITRRHLKQSLIATFTFLYKSLLNILPILRPAVQPQAPSVDGYPDDLLPRTRDKHLLIRKKTRRWHAALAGALAGGLAIMWERKMRKLLALQLFVRYLYSTLH